MIKVEHFLVISAFLFAIGIAVAITKKNAVMVLMGIELMLNAANLNLIAFSKYDAVKIQGQMFSLFVMIIAAAEISVALALVLKIYEFYKTTDFERVKELKN